MTATNGALIGAFQGHGEDILQVKNAAGVMQYQINEAGVPLVQNGQALAGVGAPSIVASVSLTGVGFAVFNTAAAVNLLPATAPAGLYRANVQLLCTTTFVTNTEEKITLGWTDESQAQTNVIVTTPALTAGSFASGTLIFESNGTAAITYTPAVTGSAATAGAASIYIRLERI